LQFRTAAAADGEHESRMDRSHRPTSALLGAVFTASGAMTSAPYQVLDPGHWALAGTQLARGDLFGTESLHERCPGGASGHETDKVTSHSAGRAEVIAKGMNADGGGAEAVCFRTDSGGEVFSAGSITWPAAILVDDGVATVTKNVLERFLA
jgi:hypothetical protein